MPQDRVVEWLLEPNQPSIRYLTLTQLLGKEETESDVKTAKARIPKMGWVAEILARRDPGGWWVRPRGWLEPRFLGTNWNMLALSDLGASRAPPEGRTSLSSSRLIVTRGQTREERTLTEAERTAALKETFGIDLG